MVEPGQSAYLKLRAEFGSEYFDDVNGGVLLRKKLGDAVFTDPVVGDYLSLPLSLILSLSLPPSLPPSFSLSPSPSLSNR